jgi:transposase
LKKTIDKRDKVSIITAIKNDGFVYYEIIPGNVNKKIFQDFLKNLFKKLPSRKYGIVLDNVAFHKSKDFIFTK